MNSLAALHWREPLWLLLMLHPVLTIALPAWLRRRRAGSTSSWVEAALQPWVLQPNRPRNKYLPSWQQAATTLVWLLLAIAAAGPRLPPIDASRDQGAGQDLVVLIDASRSMHAADIHPSRLRRARVEIHELLQRVPAARVTLLVYAGKPHVLFPPSNDHHALGRYLQQLDQIPLPTSGSNSGKALQLAFDTALAMQTQRRQASASGYPSSISRPTKPSAAVIWLTDGDLSAADTASSTDSLKQLAGRFREQQLPLSILGLGTTTGGSIPLPEGGWLKHQQRAVTTRMDSNALQQLADAAGGQFSLVQDDDSDWQQLYDRNIAAHIAPQLKDPHATQWRELFPWALAPALALLLLAGWPSAAWAARAGRAALSLSMLIPALTLLAALVTPPPLQAADRSTLRQAWQHYQAGDYPEAISAYATLRGYSARMGEASANYRNGQFDHASRQFGQTLLLASNDPQRADALYNLGNSLFREGRYADAGEAFADALRYNPELQDSRFNLDLSLALHAAVAAAQRRQQGGELAGNARIGGRIEGEVRPEDNNDTVSDGISSMPDIIAALPETPLGQHSRNALAQQLIARGLAHATTSRQTPRSDQQTPKDALRARQDLVQARLGMAQLSDRQASLWKRLFEMEEGFPAPLEQPQAIPGLAPW